MNQDKIGKFILKLRKEKNMTQQELADKLNVTDRAVSHWENGRSLPDVSLFKPLCEILGISVNELISGEKLSKDKIIKKSDENILTSMKKNKEQKKKANIIIISLIAIFIFIIACLISVNNNSKINLVNDSDDLYEKAINYLRNEEFKNNPDSKLKDFNTFYSYYGFGIEKKKDYKYVYMWVYNQSFFLEEGDALAMAGGKSIPLKFIFKDDEIISYEAPKSGGLYTSSIKEIFPGIIATQVLNFDQEKNINKLFNEVLDKKNKYYNYLNLDMNNLKIEDISYDNVIFTVSTKYNHCVPVELVVFKDNKYTLFTAYQACRPNTFCNAMLHYTKSKTGTYNYDVMQIIKHSTDANNLQFTNDNLPEYMIYGGNGHQFITDSDNKYLNEFLKLINVDLFKCADPDYT